MGCIQCIEEREAIARSMAIDNALKQDGDRAKQEYKLLLLGMCNCFLCVHAKSFCLGLYSPRQHDFFSYVGGQTGKFVFCTGNFICSMRPQGAFHALMPEDLRYGVCFFVGMAVWR